MKKIKKINFIKINLTVNYKDNTQEEDKINDSIFFIYVYDINKIGAIKIRNKKLFGLLKKNWKIIILKLMNSLNLIKNLFLTMLNIIQIQKQQILMNTLNFNKQIM